MITEGSRINYLNKEIEKLKAIRANVIKSTKVIDKDIVISHMSRKIEKLEKELANWENLYNAALEEQVQAQPAITQQHFTFNKDFINFIKRLENDAATGFDGKMWHLHKSPEGGLPEIGYGHKIQNRNELTQYKNGISNTDVEKLLLRDLESARQKVHSYIFSKYKVKLVLPLNKEEMLTEFAFNLGGLYKFPKFVDAVLRDQWDVVKKEYKRTATIRGIRGELTTRNREFYNRFLKNIPPSKALKENIENYTPIGNCRDNELIDNIFGSVSEFARQIEKFGDNFLYDGIKITYDPKSDIHTFWKKGGITENINPVILEGAVDKAAEDFVKKIIKGTEWEGKVFIAGGYVRDEFMGKDPKDLDLLVNAPNGGFEFAKWITRKTGTYKGPEVDPPIPPEPDINWNEEGKPATPEEQKIFDDWLKEIGKIQKLYTNPVIFPRFGTAKFNLRHIIHNGIDLSDMDIECVMPRKEEYRKGSRKPKVVAGTLKTDAERRDFTTNSLLKDLTSGEILDLTGMGKADIKAGIIKTAIDPDQIFKDDPLRMLRAIRFTVKYNWQLPMFMIRALKKNAPQLKNISQDRIHQELNKMLVTAYPDKAIELMRITGLMEYVAPELLKLYKLQQNKFHKDDAWKHTLKVLRETQPILLQRLIALFHDIGKFATKTVTDTGVHFIKHEKEGAEIAAQVMRRLSYPNELIDAVKAGVRYHMKLKHGGDEANISDKTLRELSQAVGENLEDVLSVIHADNISHADASSMPNQISKVRERFKTLVIRQNIEGKKENLPISGKDLLDMGVPEGKSIGRIKNVIKKAVLKNPNLSREEAIRIAGRVMATLLRRQPLKESIDLPLELEREAEGVTKAAIGWLYSSLFVTAYHRLETKERQQEASVKALSKFPLVVKKFHDTAKPGSQKSLRLTIYESFTWENLKKNIHHITVTMIKDERGNTTIKTNPKYSELDGYFYVYGEWADPDRDNPEKYYRERYVNDVEKAWEETKKYKDEYTFEFVHSAVECERYKSFREPISMIKNPLSSTASKWKLDNGDPYVLLILAKFEKEELPFYFNVVKHQKDITVKYPDYESGSPENPYVYMTLVSDYIVDFKGLDKTLVDKKVLTAKHEAIHLVQDIKKRGIQTGLPKQSLLHKHNISVRGTTSSGIASPESPHKDPEDKDDRVVHAYRDVEFKSNELNILKDFQKMLGDNLPRTEWEKGFKMLIDDITGKYNQDYEARKKFKEIFKWTLTWNMSVTKTNLEKIYQNDKPKFRQYVNEIHKLLFISPREYDVKPTVGSGTGIYYTG